MQLLIFFSILLKYSIIFLLQVVELASLASVESAIGRLQCVHSTIELIQAQAKEARVTLHQYKDQGIYVFIFYVDLSVVYFYITYLYYPEIPCQVMCLYCL